MADTIVGGILEEGFMLILPLTILLFAFIPGLILNEGYEMGLYFKEVEKILILHSDSTIEMEVPMEIGQYVVQGDTIILREGPSEGFWDLTEELVFFWRDGPEFTQKTITITPKYIWFRDGEEIISEYNFFNQYPYKKIDFNGEEQILIITT